MPETVTICCSLALAKRLGAVTCGEAELHETWFSCPTMAHKNFRVRPVDGPNQEPYIWWKWEVMQPSLETTTKFLAP